MMDANAHRRLPDGCRRSAERHTTEHMVENFSIGI
jgi:hypothetical protein